MAIEQALSWAISKANGNATYNIEKGYAGYSQYPGSPTDINPEGESYVCASFVWYALTNGGFDVGGATAAVGSTLDRYLCKQLSDAGWQLIKYQDSIVQRGDVLIRLGSHTALALSNTQTVEASNHYPSVPTQDIGFYSVRGRGWNYIFRQPAGNLKWIEKPATTFNPSYTYAETENNVRCFAAQCKSYGFSDVSIAAMLGNIAIETGSTMNPGTINFTEKNGDRPTDYGIGLCQWTGQRHFDMVDFVTKNNGYWYSGIGQTAFLKKELSEKQWYVGSGIVSKILPEQYQFRDGIKAMQCSTWTIEQATAWFFQCFEYVAIIQTQSTWGKHFSNRLINAQKWLDYLNKHPVNPDFPFPFPADKSRKMKVWMMAMRNAIFYRR